MSLNLISFRTTVRNSKLFHRNDLHNEKIIFGLHTLIKCAMIIVIETIIIFDMSRCVNIGKLFFLYLSTKTYVVGTQKNRLNETVLLSTQNIC